MKPRVPLRLAVLAVGLGLLGGVLFPIPFRSVPPAEATGIPVWLGVQPGATNTLTCGWHGTCYEYPDAPTQGSALDWSNGGSQPPVYWRSWGARYDQHSSVIAVGTIHAASGGTCKEVSAKVRDIFGYDKTDISYVHSWTYTDGWEFNINGGSAYSPAWTSLAVAYSIPPYPHGDNQGCPSSAQHLHQYAGWPWEKQTANYHTPPCYKNAWCTPAPGNDGAGATYAIQDLGMSQYTQWWCWYC